MRDYEVLIIFNPKTEEPKIDDLLDKIKGVLSQSGGEVGTIEKMGRRRLAYEFKKANNLREGFFVCLDFKGDNNTIKELEKLLKYMEESIRHLISKKSLKDRPLKLEVKEKEAESQEGVEVNPDILIKKEEAPVAETKES